MDKDIAGIIRAGIVQDGAETIDHGLLLIGDYAGKAAATGCGMLCFPEAFLTGYSTNTPVSLKRDDHVITQVSGIAIKTGVDLIVGFIENDEYLYITQGIFFADGRIEFYRKTHLGENESKIFKPGNELPVFRLSCGLQAAVQICVETHFPEISQVYALKGAAVIFCPFAVPGNASNREQIWKKYIPARSYDNRLYMACCNLLDNRHNGGIIVTDPDGEIISEDHSGQPGMLTFNIDAEKVRTYRNSSQSSMKSRFYPKRRRPELYNFFLKSKDNN